MARVRRSVEARADLRVARSYVAQYSVVRADELIQTLRNVTARLGLFPLSGRQVPERNVEWLREVIHRDYRIMYDYREARGEV